MLCFFVAYLWSKLLASRLKSNYDSCIPIRRKSVSIITERAKSIYTVGLFVKDGKLRAVITLDCPDKILICVRSATENRCHYANAGNFANKGSPFRRPVRVRFDGLPNFLINETSLWRPLWSQIELHSKHTCASLPNTRANKKKCFYFITPKIALERPRSITTVQCRNQSTCQNRKPMRVSQQKQKSTQFLWDPRARPALYNSTAWNY